MIIKRIGHIIMNVITLIHYKLQDLAMRALEVLREFRSISKEYHKHLKSTIDYLDNPRYISADYDEQDIMELYTEKPSDTSRDRDTSNKWDKKTAPYCETP